MPVLNATLDLRASAVAGWAYAAAKTPLIASTAILQFVRRQRLCQHNDVAIQGVFWSGHDLERSKMRTKHLNSRTPAEQVVKDIRRATRKHYSAEEKIRSVLDGLRGEDSIADLCRREGIAQSMYYTWSKEF